MSAIEKIVEWLEEKVNPNNNEILSNADHLVVETYHEALKKALALLSAEKAKPQAPAGLVEDIETWGNKAVLEGNASNIDWASFDEILSRHEAEQGEGLRVNCVHRENIPIKRQVKSCQKRFGLCSSPCPDGADENCTCPTSAKAVEPLACLADRKGYCIRLIGNHGYPVGWLIHLQPKRALINGGLIEIPEGDNVDTYAQAEQAARAYLEGLADKEGA